MWPCWGFPGWCFGYSGDGNYMAPCVIWPPPPKVCVNPVLQAHPSGCGGGACQGGATGNNIPNPGAISSCGANGPAGTAPAGCYNPSPNDANGPAIFCPAGPKS